MSVGIGNPANFTNWRSWPQSRGFAFPAHAGLHLSIRRCRHPFAGAPEAWARGHIADAYLDRAPIVAITGQASSDKLRKEAQQVPPARMRRVDAASLPDPLSGRDRPPQTVLDNSGPHTQACRAVRCNRRGYGAVRPVRPGGGRAQPTSRFRRRTEVRRSRDLAPRGCFPIFGVGSHRTPRPVASIRHLRSPSPGLDLLCHAGHAALSRHLRAGACTTTQEEGGRGPGIRARPSQSVAGTYGAGESRPWRSKHR